MFTYICARPRRGQPPPTPVVDQPRLNVPSTWDLHDYLTFMLYNLTHSGLDYLGFRHCYRNFLTPHPYRGRMAETNAIIHLSAWLIA